MTNTIEVAIFPTHSMGFYPSKLQPAIDNASFEEEPSFIDIRANIFPKFIKEQMSIDVTTREAQQLYDELGEGESFRINDRFYCAEMIFVSKFTADDSYIPSNISKERFKSMKPGEVIKYKNKEFRKSTEDEYINVYEVFKSTCEIVEVDMDRPWTIDDYDGAEYIEYLDYDIIDETLNYCERKGE